MSKNEVRKILKDCKNASTQEQIYKFEEELNRIYEIDLTFKGVKVT